MTFVAACLRAGDAVMARLGLLSSDAGRIRGFDGVRGIAAALVLAHHTLLTDRHLGAVSVYVFFALSGFLIIKSLHEARARLERDDGAPAAAFGLFLWRRAVRLAPPYYLAAFLVCVFFLATGRVFGDVFTHRLAYATFTQNLLVAFVTHAWGAFSHTWSLAVEQQAYLVCGLALLTIPARRHGLALAVLAAASFVASVATATADPDGLSYYCLPFNGLVFMVTGGAFAIYGPNALAATHLSEGARAAGAAALGVAIVAVAFTIDGPTVTQWSPGAPSVAVNPILAVAASSFLLLLAESPESRVARLLEFRPLAALGAVSYAFYVVQLPIAHIVSHAFERFDFAAKREALFAIDFVLATLVSVLSFALVERPLARFKNPRLVWQALRPAPAVAG